MDYRKEVDGLRALAVLPVVFFHAGLSIFQGGFVGVDIFFVISGYLITTIIIAELRVNNFSIFNFYERRARRILPVLFFVMVVSSIFGYFWMMPDEFKNFGQSLTATSLLSNNNLLAITSGYWDLNSEFKPLLHTWSLGVEEQYYIIFPFLIIFFWKYFRNYLAILIAGLAVASFILANYCIQYSPTIAFYILPTRAWEILLGALVGLYLSNLEVDIKKIVRNNSLSFFGFFLIIFSILFFNQNNPSPGIYTLIPTIAAALIIIFARRGTIVHYLLSCKFMVGIGVISYSLYLWHQPLFAFSRIFPINKPSQNLSLFLLTISFMMAYLTWKFIEKPFRSKKLISGKFIAYSSLFTSVLLITFGIYLNSTYGMAHYTFGSNININDMDKRIYNQRVFKYKKDSFSTRDKKRIIVVGNSFGRDFVNITTETFNTNNVEIVYRDDLSYCLFPFENNLAKSLYGSADVIVFMGFNKGCVTDNISFIKSHDKKLFYIGTKNFGYNLNWIRRLDKESRANQYNPLLNETIAIEKDMTASVPKDNFISLLSPVTKNNLIPITDDLGRMLSTDKVHLTKYGAIFFGNNVLRKSRYGELFPGR